MDRWASAMADIPSGPLRESCWFLKDCDVIISGDDKQNLHRKIDALKLNSLFFKYRGNLIKRI